MYTRTQPQRQQTRVSREHRPATIPPAVTNTPSSGSSSAVFTGDWLAGGCACHTYREGYAGILTRRWNGWAVFTVTRPVAQAIVRRHQADFTQLMGEQIGGSGDPAGAWRATLRTAASVTWLTDMIVVDSRVWHDDDTAVEISAPSPDGRYSIGWGWMWDDVEAADIHTVHTGRGR